MTWLIQFIWLVRESPGVLWDSGVYLSVDWLSFQCFLPLLYEGTPSLLWKSTVARSWNRLSKISAVTSWPPVRSLRAFLVSELTLWFKHVVLSDKSCCLFLSPSRFVDNGFKMCFSTLLLRI